MEDPDEEIDAQCARTSEVLVGSLVGAMDDVALEAPDALLPVNSRRAVVRDIH